MTRLLIADDHEVVRSGLRAVLEAHPGWEVVAEAADGKEAIKQALETKPDVAVIDYSLPLLNGIEATRQIRKRESRTDIYHARRGGRDQERARGRRARMPP